MIWWLAFEKKPFQFWREIWIQVVVILLQLYSHTVCKGAFLQWKWIIWLQNPESIISLLIWSVWASYCIVTTEHWAVSHCSNSKFISSPTIVKLLAKLHSTSMGGLFKCGPSGSISNLPSFSIPYNMAIPVLEFSMEGYKLERFLAKNQHTQKGIIEFWELV